MKIYIMRHGEATHFAASDAERELTPLGKSQSLQAANEAATKGLNNVELTLVSPYIRAQQTWDTIASSVNSKQVETCADITPYGQADDVYQFVLAKAKTEKLESVLLVSHLPLVGYLTAEFVRHINAPMFPTSGIVGIEFDLETEKGELMWQLRPSK